jgi:DNA repair exonuclease SbcCD ATPase subunit
MAVKKEIEINVNTSKAEKNVDNLEGGLSGLSAQADKLTGGLVSGFKKGVAGIKQGITAMKSLRVAIAATGIGALLIAVTSLVSYFTKTQRGADKLSQALKGMGAVVDVLVDRFSTFGEGIFAIFSGDFAKGVDILKGTFKGLGQEIREEAKAAIELEKAFQALQDREIAMIETRAERRASIEALRLVAADETKDLAARANALKEAMDLEKQLADEEIEIAKERARIIKERNALGESTRDDIQAEAEANARVIELNAQRDTRLKELVATYNSLNKQHQEQIRLLREEESAQVSLNAKTIDSKKFAVDNELQMHQMLRTNMAMIDQQYANQADQIRKDSLKKTREQKMAELSIVAGTLGSLSQLAGENAQAGKALSAAEAIINTYTGATKALAQGGIFGAVAAAGVVASGIASVRQIYATPVPTPSGGSVSGGGARPQISAPAITPRLSLNTQVSDLGNQITESLSKTPVRAYVVNQDVQTAAKMDRKIRETATIG